MWILINSLYRGYIRARLVEMRPVPSREHGLTRVRMEFAASNTV
jgi:hypothetical protein